MLKWIKEHSKWAMQFLLGAALIVVYKTFDNLSSLWTGIGYIFDALKPFLIAFVIAYMLNIPIKKLNDLLSEKVNVKFIKKHSNALSIAVVYVLFVALFTLVFGSIIPAIAGDLVEMSKNIPQYADNIVKSLNNLDIVQRFGIDLQVVDLSAKMSDIIDTFLSVDLVDYTKSLTLGVVSVTSGLLDVFIALIASVYMLIEKERIIKGIKKLAAVFSFDGKADTAIMHFSSVNEIFTQYVYSRLTCCLVIGIASSLFLLIAGEKYALLLGIFIGFMDLIPYFGSIISWFLGLLVMTISGGFGHAIWCSAVILVLQQLDGNVLAPKVMGSRLEISPLTVIIAVSVGGSLFGFMGMIISVPVVAIIRAVFVDLIEDKAKENNISIED